MNPGSNCAADGKLYHVRKTEGGQSVIVTVQPFAGLSTRIENEPTLFASATDQLELAATTVNGDLVYAHWRDEVWGDQITFPPATTAPTAGYRGKPAIIASAPGQVEIIVEGRNGGFWHLRRWDGVWESPVAVPLPNNANLAPPFRDPVAVQSGNKIVVVLADGQNRVLAIAFDLESRLRGQPNSLLGQEIVKLHLVGESGLSVPWNRFTR